ncbi:recombinase family protein [Streptodolium elevatio]|uniref:Recombinase family protein n=1 Tax=Streptodolium elevatio TaxID=3157996 RepID=A0ABV3DI61_9ACTN
MTPIGDACALYGRISDDKTGEELGVQRQDEDGTALADVRGLHVVARYVDNDISATKGKRRPDYERMMAAAERGEFKFIIVWMLSRLWRNRRERVDGIERLRKAGVGVLCVKGPDLDLTTAAGRLLAGLLGEVDTHEVEQKAERQEREMRQTVERGVAPGGRRAFGYPGTMRGDDGKRVPVPDEQVEREAAAVKWAFGAALGGATLSGIATSLNEMGLPTTMGGPWKHNAVRVMLLNERYAALREYKGELFPGKWSALVPEETWRAVCALLTDEERRSNHTNARRWLLTGIALCGVCGDLVISTYRDNKRRVYRCRASAHLLRTAEPIDELVVATTVARLSRPDARDLLIDDTRPDIDGLRVQAVALRERLDNFAHDYADGLIDRRQMRAGSARVRAALAEVESQMVHLDRADVLRDLVESEDVAAAWNATTFGLDRQRAVIRTLWTVTIQRSGPGRRVFDPRTVSIAPAA